MIEVKIETRKVEYDLKIHGKYTILLGASGSGKTRLAKDVYTLNRVQPYALYSGYKVYSVPAAQNVDTGIFEGSGAIIIFDDDLDQKDMLRFLPMIKQSENYFIFIGRGISFVPYGVEDVFEMVGTKRHMSMQQAYRFPKRNVASHNLLSEDAKLGAAISEKISKVYGYSVYSAAGKDNLVAKLIDLNLNNVTVLADLSGLGTCLGPLHDCCNALPGVAVCDSQSFDCELLENLP